jgi:polysaccharide pyruvyl transferase WcaK-like protein
MMVATRNMAQTTRWALQRLGAHSGLHVGYIGGHGGGNLGDDMMRGIVRELFPQHRLVDCVESWHEKRLAKVGLSGPRYFQHVLLGGGTLISPFWYGKVETAIEQGIPISTLGTGAGSCGFIQDDTIDLSQWAPLLKRFKYLGVRGPRSVKRLQAIGVEHAEAIGDLALYLTRDEPVEPDPTPTIAVNLSLPAKDEPQCGEAQRFEELVHTLRPYVRRGWALRPYAMHAADVEPTRHLVERLQGASGPVPHLDSVDAFFNHVGPATVNIAVRLHGVILGCCAGVPPIILGYRDKCLDFAESLYLQKSCIYMPTARMGDVTITTNAAIETAPQSRHRMIGRAQALKTRLLAYTQQIAEQTS